VKKDVQKVIQEIRDHQSFFVTAHVNPEADAMGSSLALVWSLRQLGKQAQVVSHDPLPKILSFLPHQGILTQATEIPKSPDALFILDCGDIERTGFFDGRKRPSFPVINIDHHITNKKFGTVNWIDPDAAATAELIYDLDRELGVDLTPEIAICLYAALVGETGFFAYSNTSPKVLRIAAELVDRGVDPWAVAQKLRENSMGRIRLLGELLLGLEQTPDGKIAWLTVTQDHFKKTGTAAEDLEEFVGYPRSLKGVEVALLFREVDPETCKVSFRSRDRVDVAALAQQFGGGGHRKAAGCTVQGRLKEVQTRVIQAVKKELPAL
jgi:bifunctional oligoribonuclease and PAP phosphatase NrnA